MLWLHLENVDLNQVKVVHYYANGSKPWRFTGNDEHMDRNDIMINGILEHIFASSMGLKVPIAKICGSNQLKSKGLRMELTVTQPDDWHLHLRDGDLLKEVVPHSASHFGRAIVMPNLKPPITTTAAAVVYRDSILKAPLFRKGIMVEI
ncbi:hypothetical protein EZV62_001652 [Acer yangbiense]|uniref:Uncharacterized protein n=1 Tax=Acer yangbiense TaxID=1000413 RepID=A0A5C7IUX5_9ROSI|nr:hypothetical protein EZV62_001652 [Acer yangbiense]